MFYIKVKFHLNLQDEGDSQHWLFATNLSPSLNEEKEEEEEEEEEATIIEQQPTADNDFMDPSIDDDDFNAIPIIDLSQPKHIYAKQIADACRNVGFFYIINHGVGQDVMDSVMDQSKNFFDLDLNSKLAVSNSGSAGEKKGHRGYFEIGGEDLENKDSVRDLYAEEGGSRSNLNSPKKGDYKEGFDCGIDNEDALQFFGDNKWPDETTNPSIEGFRRTLMEYQSQLIQLSDVLMLALASSLKHDNPNGGDVVADDYFIRQSRNPLCTLRLLHYPPIENCTSSSLGCGAHTDYGLFTILQQDAIGGLQVRNHSKEWIDATPVKGSFVINCGDMLHRWTDGEYASTVHRVISPSVSGDRYSVPFFFNPDAGAVVKPLGSSNADEHEVAATALDILQARYDGTFQKK